MTTSWSRFKGEYAKNHPGIGGIENGKKTERGLRLIVGTGATSGRAAGPSERLASWLRLVADHGSSLRGVTSVASLSKVVPEVELLLLVNG